MELRQLRYFLAVADELHFGRAAERLHIVQSAVSQQIRRLERELGADLFDRSTRSVRLTEAGRRLAPHAREVLAAAARARGAIDELRAERDVTLRLGTSAGLGTRLDTILAEFAGRAPHAQLELVTAATEERLKQVRSGDLDATLLRSASEERERTAGPTAGPAAGPAAGSTAEAELELLPLWQDPVLVALPAGHELARGAETEAVPMAELAELPLRISPRSRNRALFDLVTRSCREAGFEPVLGPEFTTAQDTLAAIGFGRPSWTVFYAPHAEQLPVPGVVFRPLRDPVPLMRCCLAVRPEPPRAELRALIEACHAA